MSKFFRGLFRVPERFLYQQDNFELEQCCNLLPEITRNKERLEIKKMYPVTQIIRLVCAVTLFG